MTEGIQGGLPQQRRSGWFAMVVAVGVLLIILGVWNAIDGLTALLAGDFVVADAELAPLRAASGVGRLLVGRMGLGTAGTGRRRGGRRYRALHRC